MGVESVADLPSDSRNTLLLSPAFSPHGDSFCGDLLAARVTDETALLLVTNRESVDESIRRWARDAHFSPAQLGAIAMGESTRSAAAAGVQSSGAPGLTVETIAHPGDLTGVGIKVTEQLNQWQDGDREIVACFDSLTVLLQYAPVEKVYQFLHVFTQQMKAADVSAHYHIDPSAHDDETVYTLLPLFDTLVEFDADGIESVHTR